MCEAIKRAQDICGVSNKEVSRELGVAQGTTWKWMTYREPGFAEVQAIEKVLGLAPGTLFAMAGYAPAVNAADAVKLDPLLTDTQRARIAAAVERARDKRKARTNLSSAAMVAADHTLPEQDRFAIAGMIRAAIYENQQKISGSKH